MKVFSVFFQVIFILSFGSVVFAQDSSSSAKEEFESYERNFSQVTTTAKPASASGSLSINPAEKPRRTTPKPRNKPTAPQNKPVNKPRPAAAAKNVGLPGMKIWLEKQTNCAGAFTRAAPTSIFRNGDCVRVKFRLNFEGYLTIFNRGSSGSLEKIFPLNNQNNRVFPKTDNLIPDNRGWEFYGKAGNENLFFIVSKLPLANESHRDLEDKEVEEDSGEATEIYDRDLKPRTEKNEIFVLANETRFEKPLIFRLRLRHR